MCILAINVAIIVVRQPLILFPIKVLLFIALVWRDITIQTRKKLMAWCALMFAVMALLLASRGDRIFESFLSLSSDISSTRSTIQRHAITLIVSNPVLGVGFGHYVAHSWQPVVISGVEVFVASAHNGFLGVAAEMGIIGLAAFGWLCYVLLRENLQTWRDVRKPLYKGLTAFILLALIMALVGQMYGDSGLLPPAQRGTMQSSLYVWVLFGLTRAIRRIEAATASE